MFWVIPLYWAMINLLTFWLFKLDKSRAINDGWRISEQTLLMSALIGGSFGAKQAQTRFRHKTRKEPFATLLNVICILHGLLIIGAVLWRLGLWPLLQNLVQ